MLKLARRLSIAAALGMLIVLLMGTVVTKTGSGKGCGASWPLCNGEFIPAYTFEAAVEYSHRAVTGVEGLLLIGASATAFRFRKQLPELKVLIPVTLLTLVLQSFLGMKAAQETESALVLASHFGISLTALASTALMAFVLGEGPDRRPRNDAAVSSSYRVMSLLTIIAMLGVAYAGAYVRHTKSSLACGSWPLCNGKVLSGLTGSEAIVVGHRIVALLAVFLILGMWLWARKIPNRPDISRAGAWAFGLIIAQALSGALLPLTSLSMFSTMTHALIMALLFVTCCEWSRRALPRPAAALSGQRGMLPSTAPAAD